MNHHGFLIYVATSHDDQRVIPSHASDSLSHATDYPNGLSTYIPLTLHISRPLHDTDPYLSYYPPFSLSSILHPLLSCIFLKAFPFIRIDSDPFPVSVRTANECCALALKRTARFQSHSNRLLVIERLRQLRQPLSQPKNFASAMSPLMLGPFVPLTLTLRCQCLSVPQLAVVVLASSFVSPPSAAHELQLPHSEP